jgi:processive 1,2-diacylglycerol beta-glucosyltransferase
MADSSTILILTAGFGDGHNSAARSVAEALRRESGGRVTPLVVDLFEDAAPVTGAFYKWCYRQMITHLPALWSWLFHQSKTGNFTNLWWDHFVGVGRALERRLREHRPAVVLVTYPVYPYFFRALRAEVPRPERILMAVTDSITIHPIWLHVKVDRLFVTDLFSRTVACEGQSEEVPVEVSGFPVAPGFADFPDREPSCNPAALQVLYFATTAQWHVRLTLQGLLPNLPAGAVLTVVMGRNEARLSPVVQEMEQAFPGVCVKRIGWTREVPQLLMTHDVVISKAGGATVHECFAAGVPVVVNYIIPGQEEGNVELLERLGCGCRSMVPEETGALLAAIVSDGRLAAMRAAMAQNRRPDGAIRIAREVLAGLQSV